MKNYYVRPLENFRKERPDAKTKEFKTLKEYEDIAKKIITKFAPSKQQAKVMLSSTDWVGDIIFALASRDWDYDKTKGRTSYSWKNNGGIWAILDGLSSNATIKNQERSSLDMQFEDGSNISESIEDKKAIDPRDLAEQHERKNRLSEFLEWIMENANLSEVQKRVLHLRYVEDIESTEEIAQRFDPPVSRQNVSQILDRAVAQLKLTAKGTDSK